MFVSLVRVATWNLERPAASSWKRLPAQMRQIDRVAADVWVLTESRASLPLPPSLLHAAHCPPHRGRRPDPDERWASIWSSYPLADAGIAPSPRGTIAQVVSRPIGDRGLWNGGPMVERAW